MTDAHKMPATFRAALDAALSRPLLLDQRAYEPLLDAGGLRPRLDVMDGEEEDDVGPAPRPAPFALAGDVAVVTVEGPLSQRAWSCWMFRGDGYDAIVDRARAAFADPQARGVVLRLDSPGGEVAGCFEAVRALRAMARNAGKPLVAYVDEMACSAAYALACACDEIVAPDTGMVGSIGVIMSVASRAGELAARGVSVAVISSGKAKADGHPALPLADDARARLQADVDTLAGIFAAEVAASRPLSAAEVLALEAQVFIGAAARSAGLVDEVGPLSAAVGRARALAASRPAPPSSLPTGARRATNHRTSTMNEQQLAALAAAFGESDPDKIVAAAATLSTRAAAAEASLARMTADHNAALERAQAAEKRAEAMERDAEVAAAKVDGQWTPALEGFLGSLSVAQLRVWRASAPRAVPAGEKQPPADAQPAAGQVPSDFAAAVAKASESGWSALTPREKHAVTSRDPKLAASLKRGAAV